MLPPIPARFARPTLFLLGALALTTARAETVLVADEFADGSRRGNSPPESLDWVSSVDGRYLEGDRGKMRILGARESGRHAVAHFVAPEDAVTLETGETLEFTFDVTPLEEGPPQGNSLRFGLFDSANEAVNYFGSDGTNPKAASAEGYVGVLSLKSETEVALGILRRSGDGGLLTNSHAYNTESMSNAPEGVGVGETYRVTLRVKRTGDREAQVEVAVSGGTFAREIRDKWTDEESPLFTFDLIGFSIFQAFSAAEISNVRLVKLP